VTALGAALCALLAEERRRALRPTIAELEQDGPPLSPAAFAIVFGMSREYVRYLCASGGIPATQGKNGYWHITRKVARDLVRRASKPAA
jgi:hypothetical protein